MPILLLTALLILPSGLFAQGDLDSLIARAPGLETYPQASTVVLFERTRIELLPSGERVKHGEVVCKLLSKSDYSPFEEQYPPFNPEEDTLIIEVSRMWPPSEGWLDVSGLSPTRQFEAESGTAYHFAYRIEPKPSARPSRKRHCGGIVLFGGCEPILEKQLRVEVSPPWKIRYDLQNGALEPEASASESRTIYEWTVRDCPQIIREPNSVALSNLVPRVLWTSFPDWEALGLCVAEPFWEKVDSSHAAVDGFLQITSPELQGIPALYHAAEWVLSNIRIASPPSPFMDYEPRSADRVWQSRHGNALDKAVLLTALLRAYGFAPIPVLVPYTDEPFSDLPVLEQFRHVILCVPVGEDTTWLDPSASFYPPGEIPYECTYGKGCMLLAGTPLLLDVPSGLPESRGARTEMRLNLAEDGRLSGMVTCVPSGDLAAGARRVFKNTSAQERSDYAQAAASRIKPGTTVTSFSVTDPGDLSKSLTVTLRFESPAYAERAEDTMLLPVPGNPFDFALLGLDATLPEVRYPVRLPPQRRVTTEISIFIPDGFRVSVLPPPLVVRNPYVFIEIAARQGAAGFTWTSTTEIFGDNVPVADYAVLRAAYETLLLPRNRLVILEKK